MEINRGTAKGTGRGTSSKTLRDRRHGLGVPSEMLEQGSRETPVDFSSLRCLLTILSPSKIHAGSRGTVGDRATGEGEVDVREHQSFVRQIEATVVLCQVEVREQGVHDFTDEAFGYFWWTHMVWALSIPVYSAIAKPRTGTVRKAGRLRRIAGIMDRRSP